MKLSSLWGFGAACAVMFCVFRTLNFSRNSLLAKDTFEISRNMLKRIKVVRRNQTFRRLLQVCDKFSFSLIWRKEDGCWTMEQIFSYLKSVSFLVQNLTTEITFWLVINVHAGSRLTNWTCSAHCCVQRKVSHFHRTLKKYISLIIVEGIQKWEEDILSRIILSSAANQDRVTE